MHLSAIRKLNRMQRYISVVGTGSIVRGFFENLVEKVHLITSQKVISPDDNLSDYFLYLKDLNAKDMVRTLSSISGKAIFKRPGLVAVHVDPNKFNIFRKYTSGLLTHRPLIICDEEREALRNFELDCHVVKDYGNQFSITPYQVMGIADQEAYLVDQNSMKIESVSIYSGTRRGLGALIAITGGDDGAKAVGAFTLDDNEQISFVLFSQIDRSRISSGGAGKGHWEHLQGREEQPTGELAGGREEQLTGELAERREEQPTGELAERREEQPTGELAGRREEQPTGELAGRREDKPTGELAGRRQEQPTEELAGRREEQPTGELVGRREEQPTGKLAERREEQPTGELAERREEQPTEELAGRREEQPTGELAERREEQPAEELAERRAEQPAGELAERREEQPQLKPLEGEGECDCVIFTLSYREETSEDTLNHSADQHTSAQALGPVTVLVSDASSSGGKDGVTFTSNYREEAGQDTTNHSSNRYTSAQVLGPSKANSPVNVMVSFASRSGEKGVYCASCFANKKIAEAVLILDANDNPPMHGQDVDDDTLYVREQNGGYRALLKPSEGQGHCFLKLIQNKGRVVARAEFGDLEQQGGQDIDDQQNSNPQQVSRFKSVAPSSKFTEEQMNYCKLVYFIFEVVTEGLREIFKREWDNRYKKTLGEWKDTPNDGKNLEKITRLRPRGRHPNFLKIIVNGNRAEWDFSILCYAILNCDSPDNLNSTIKSNVLDLKSLRNQLAHWTTGKISNEDFQKIISKVKNAFHNLGLQEPEILGPEIWFSPEESRDVWEEVGNIIKTIRELEKKFAPK